MPPRAEYHTETMDETSSLHLKDDGAVSTKKGDDGDEKAKKKKQPEKMAPPGDVLKFIFDCGFSTQIVFICGCIAGVGNGMVYPILAFLFSTSFTSISDAGNGLNAVTEIAYTFLVVGAFAMAMATIQTGCLELAATRAARSFKLQWFKALLRQDSAFFDVHDISGISNSIGPMSNKFRRGIGRKLGEGIQFTVTFLGGLGYAFWASWRTALVVLALLPFCAIAAYFTLMYNQARSSLAAKAYARAGSVAYSTVSAIKTVLSLNAIPEMIRQYTEATFGAYSKSINILWKQGIANGSMLGTFMILYAVLALYGGYLLYNDVEDTGCDPSAGVEGNETCNNSGPDVFGAMLGIAFAAQGISQVGSFMETFTSARVACYQASLAIQRMPGHGEQVIYKTEDDNTDDKDETDSKLDVSGRSSTDEESGNGAPKIKAILPKYEIDSSNPGGLKPSNTFGRMSFKNVTFSYPTRPNSTILCNFNLEVEAGKTIALVGPSGGGKSTTVSLIERFYDPTSGSIELDGVDLKDLNLTHLRDQIGYVGQEPVLFATTIAGNIRYGNPDATQEQIEEAAKMANAHDFISSFPEGYNTQVGDKGSQLSGGQKQRLAIARALVKNPKILILDEATSALDSESEIVVQDALDNVLSEHKRTTVVIAHRLSTIRNADVIAVIAGGTVVELGTHDELIEAPTGEYRALVEKQEGSKQSISNPVSRENSLTNLEDMVKSIERRQSTVGIIPAYSFRNVSFSYPTRPDKLVFDNFNLTIRQGETVALVGPSGGGKSTAVALIERFYDPSDGVVEYENFNVTQLNPKWYRDQIGYVGQEPTLFDTTIGKNIAYGAPGATRQEIEDAAKQANAHDFIMSFTDGYDTQVGERGTQLSGGQKQRIAIARALVKKPKVLLLDEATSALDSQSESIVQEALDRLMASTAHTTIVIAHRLSTIRNVDRIAYIAHGKVLEFGSHDELMDNPKGRYKRLVEAQRRGSAIDAKTLKSSNKQKKDEDDKGKEDETPDFELELEEAEKNSFSVARARQMAAPDVQYMLVGAVGSIMAGGVFPAWGFLFAETIDLLFRRVYDCSPDNLLLLGFETCDQYIDTTVDEMQEMSFKLGIWWIVVAIGCVVGNLLVFWGFGVASERLNKRVRDGAFSALIRQEVAFFDKRSVGAITSQLEEDAARIHTFSGEPIRSLLIAISSVLTGIIISFIFMWPFALVSLATIPLMGFATEVEMRTFLGEDENDSGQDELNSPGGIVIETLLNIRTVSALTLEKTRFEDYERALDRTESNGVFVGFKAGATSGLSMLIQQWVNALQFWWGGWLLFNYPGIYSFRAFLVSMFALLFSLFGLGAAFQGMSDRKETEKSAGRIFYLLDRESEIDPLSEEGKKLNNDSKMLTSDPAFISDESSLDKEEEMWA